MAINYKVLGQVYTLSGVNTDLYTVPANTAAVCSTLAIAPISASSNVRIAVRPQGATLSQQHYIGYDILINMNDATFLTLGLTLSATDVVTVYSDIASVAFSLFGTEIV